MKKMEEGYFVHFSKMEKVYRKMCFQEVEEYNFTPNEVVVLMFLANNAGMDSASDIARYKNISKGLVARSVESLCRKGYLYTEKDENDRRLMHLQLSENSDEVLARLKKCKEAFIGRLMEDVPEEYLDITMKTADIMSHNMDQILKGMK